MSNTTYKIETTNGTDTAAELGEAFQVEYQTRIEALEIAGYLPEDLTGTDYEGTEFQVVEA